MLHGGVYAGELVLTFSIDGSHVVDEILFFDHNGVISNAIVLLAVHHFQQHLKGQAGSFSVRVGKHAHRNGWRDDRTYLADLFNGCEQIGVGFSEEFPTGFILVGSATIGPNDVDDLLEIAGQGKGLGGHVLSDRTGRSVDFPHLEANVAGDLRQLFSCFLMNHRIKTFAPREAIIGWCEEYIAAVIPDVSAHHAENTVLARTCHVEFRHRFGEEATLHMVCAGKP